MELKQNVQNEKQGGGAGSDDRRRDKGILFTAFSAGFP